MTTLTVKDEKRLDVIQRVYRSELTVTPSSAGNVSIKVRQRLMFRGIYDDDE